MTTYDYNGWIWFIDRSAVPDTYKVLCKTQNELNIEDPSAAFIDYPSDGHTGWSLGTRKREFPIKGLWFESTANYEAFLYFLESHQSDGFSLKIQITSGGAFRDWDGNNKTILPVRWSKIRGAKKTYGGNTEIWEIKQITFRQIAALEA